MARRSTRSILLFLIVLAVIGCAELPGKGGSEAGALPVVEIGAELTVPAEWGSLVSVSNSTAFPELFQLWFEDEAGNIRMVVLDDATRSLKPASVLIQRH